MKKKVESHWFIGLCRLSHYGLFRKSQFKIVAFLTQLLSSLKDLSRASCSHFTVLFCIVSKFSIKFAAIEIKPMFSQNFSRTTTNGKAFPTSFPLGIAAALWTGHSHQHISYGYHAPCTCFQNSLLLRKTFQKLTQFR